MLFNRTKEFKQKFYPSMSSVKALITTKSALLTDLHSPHLNSGENMWSVRKGQGPHQKELERFTM